MGEVTKLPRGARNKVIPCGTLHHCKFYGDKILSVATKAITAEVDERHTLWTN